MIDYSYDADENGVLTSYDSNDSLTSSENNDSGIESGQADAVNYWDFMNAWADSDNFLTIVDA
ncbi:MAG: hypothetical protein ACRC2S_13995 [Waterburya sp.]